MHAPYTRESRYLRVARWVVAGALVLALHAGAAYALLRLQEAVTDDLSGGIAIELTPVTAAPTIKSPDVAPGPPMQEEVPTPEAHKSTNRPVAEEMPPIDPAPLAPEPAVQLPSRQRDNKEPEAPRDEETSRQDSRQTNAAPVTTAPPVPVASPSNKPQAPSPGLATLAAEAQANWHKALMAHINRYKRYPADARAHRIEGVVGVEFTIDGSGQIGSARVAKSSGSAVLDEEALALLRRASPLPSPPQAASPEGFRLVLPIHFRMK